MIDNEAAFEDRGREAANAQLVEVARDAVNLLCAQVIPICFDRVNAKLAEDAVELETYLLSGSAPGTTANFFVTSGGLLDLPWRDKDPRDALSLLLTGDEDKEAVTVILPVGDSYHWPEPLDPVTDVPTELYFDYSPNRDVPEKHRFVMQRDPFDLKNRFRIFRYVSAADGDAEEHIYDTLDEFEMLANTGSEVAWSQQVVPKDAKLAIELVTLLARLVETTQDPVDSPYEQPDSE